MAARPGGAYRRKVEAMEPWHEGINPMNGRRGVIHLTHGLPSDAGIREARQHATACGRRLALLPMAHLASDDRHCMQCQRVTSDPADA